MMAVFLELEAAVERELEDIWLSLEMKQD